MAGGRGDEGSQYHRSVRTVALAGAFSTVLMVAGLVAVVIIFCAKIESLASKGQEREAEFSRTVAQQVDALHKILDELSQGRKEDRETVAELRRQLEKYAAQQPSQADFDALRNEVVALRRAAFLNAPLSPREREALKGKLQRVAANASWKTRQTLSKLERAVTAGNYTRKAVSDMAREARQDIKDERARAKFDAEGLGQFNAE